LPQTLEEEESGMKQVIVFISTAILLVTLTAFTQTMAADVDVCSTCTHNTIQAAIGAASNGDRIRIAQDTYNENLNVISSGEITLIISGGWLSDFSDQSDDPSLTVIDGGAGDKVLAIYGAPGDVTVENLTIQNGRTTGADWGAGIEASSLWGEVHLTVRNVVVQDCDSTDSPGGGMALFSYDNPLEVELDGVILRRNHADDWGGAVSIAADENNTPGTAKIFIVNSLVQGNTADNREGGGIAAWTGRKSSMELAVINSTITGNTSNDTAKGGGGMSFEDDGDLGTTAILQLYNTILHGNTADPGSDLFINLSGSQSRVDAYYNDIGGVNHSSGEYNTGNNLDTSPMFVDAGMGNYHLQSASLLVDAGTIMVPSPPDLPFTDFEGEGRNVDGDKNGTSAPDMGFDEYIPNFDKLTVISPNGREKCAAGSNFKIQWGKPAAVDNVKLLYSLNNGSKWKLIQQNLSGTHHDWSVPVPSGNKKKCLIKAVGYDLGSTKLGADKSDLKFQIVIIRITTPNGGEALGSGEQYDIKWNTNSTRDTVSKAVVFHTKNGGKTWKKIRALAGNPGTLQWDVPMVEKTRKKCKVKVILKDSMGGKLGADTSDSFFKIKKP
jgi:hypothetical protein